MPSLYIDGKWTTGTGGTADVLNPFDASVVEAVDQAGPDDVDAAVAAARAAFDDPRGWRATSVADRAGVLRRVADLLQRDKEHLARIETLDTGKTLIESRIDVDDVTAVFRYYADLVAGQDGRCHLSEFVDRAEREHERIVVTRNGRPAAVLLAYDDLAALEETLDVLSDPDALADIRQADAEVGRGEVVRGVEAVRALRSRT